MRRYPPIWRLLEVLEYEPGTGLLTWKERSGKWSSRWNSRYAGKTAGTTNRQDGYVHIKVDERNWCAHRIIWAMTAGYWPEVVDHINGNPSDNRWCNLRAVDQATNQRNQKMHITNRSGVTGVHSVKHRGDWLASIRVDGVQIHLGYFKEKEDAVNARRIAEKTFGFTGRV